MRADVGQRGSSADRHVPGCSSSLRSLMSPLSLDPKGRCEERERVWMYCRYCIQLKVMWWGLRWRVELSLLRIGCGGRRKGSESDNGNGVVVV